MCVPSEVEDASYWAHLYSASHTGLFQGLNRSTDLECALFLRS